MTVIPFLGMAKRRALSSESHFTVKSDLVSREVRGEEIILDLVTGTYFGLNTTGARMWQMLRCGKKVGEISTALAKELGADEDRVKRDLVALVGKLLAKGLLEAAP